MVTSSEHFELDEVSVGTDAGSALSARALIGYASPAAGLGMMFMLASFYLMKYSTDVLLIAPVTMSLIFAASKVLDAISDPVVGHLSDRTHSRFGRRRSWMIFSSIPLVVLFLAIWNPPTLGETGTSVAWMAVTVPAFYVLISAAMVPHMSLGAELTFAHHERTRVFGYRSAAFSAGGILGVGALAVLMESADQRATSWWIGIVAGGLLLISIGWCVQSTEERSDYQGRGGKSALRSMIDVWSNPHARLLLTIYVLASLGSATMGILTPYIGEYVLGKPQVTPLALLTFMGTAILSIPAWVKISERIGKRRSWIISLMLFAGTFGALFFVERGGTPLFLAMSGLAGCAEGCTGVVGSSIKADVIDYDELMTGERKEGSYFAAWNFAYKAAAGVPLILTGLMLQFSGFIPNAEQSESTKFWMVMLVSLVPALAYVVAVVLASRFRLDEVEHARIRTALDTRNNSEVSLAPL